MRVLWFGTYSVGGGYPRNTVLMDALREVEVLVPLGLGLRKARCDVVTGQRRRLGATSALTPQRISGGRLRRFGVERVLGGNGRVRFRPDRPALSHDFVASSSMTS